MCPHLSQLLFAERHFNVNNRNNYTATHLDMLPKKIVQTYRNWNYVYWILWKQNSSNCEPLQLKLWTHQMQSLVILLLGIITLQRLCRILNIMGRATLIRLLLILRHYHEDIKILLAVCDCDSMAYIYQFIGMSSKFHSIPDRPRYTLCGNTYKRNKRLLNDIANHDFESRLRTYVITMTVSVPMPKIFQATCAI